MRPATPQVDIAGRPVGADHPPFVIAEAGINHNGQLELALRMVQVAKASGADAIKFQTFTAEGLVGDPKVTYTYQSQGKQVTESMQEMFRRVEFCPDEWRAIKHRCDETGILFLSTPQNVADLDLLLSLGVGAIKVGSDDFATLPLLKRFASTGLPLLTSCGMRTERLSSLERDRVSGWLPDRPSSVYVGVPDSARRRTPAEVEDAGTSVPDGGARLFRPYPRHAGFIARRGSGGQGVREALHTRSRSARPGSLVLGRPRKSQGVGRRHPQRVPNDGQCHSPTHHVRGGNAQTGTAQRGGPQRHRPGRDLEFGQPRLAAARHRAASELS